MRIEISRESQSSPRIKNFSLGGYARSVICSGIIFLVLTLFLATYISIYFETNDDVSMMLLAHGIGTTSRPTSLLLFSNRLQGDVIRWIGMPFGQPGYSIYMFGCLILGMSFLFASLKRLSGSVFLSAAIVAVLSVRPLFAPQFTIVASIVTLAAVVVFLDYRISKTAGLLVVAVLLAFLGVLMRVDAAAFVLLLATPILIDRASFRLPVIAAAIVFALAAIGALWWDRLGYMTPPWAMYNAVEASRAWYTDFGLGGLLADRADLLQRAGWSRNDLDMIGQWWFFDPDVYTPQRMNELMAAAGMRGLSGQQYGLIQSWFNTLLHWDTIAVAVLALSLAVWRIVTGNVRIALCLALCLLAFVGFAVLGRPGVTRVSYSAMMALLVFSASLPISTRPAKIFSSVLLLALVALVIAFVDNSRLMRSQQALALADMKRLPSEDVIVVWADAWPYQFIYPAFLGADETFPSFRIYSLGSDQLAPHALAWWGGDPARLIARLRTPEGIGLIARTDLLERLRTYCREHWDAELVVNREIPSQAWQYYDVACPSDRSSAKLRPIVPGSIGG